MNIVVMGTGQFAVPTFEWLVESPHDVSQLVTRPARQRGRRRQPPNPMRDAAKLHGVPVMDPPTVNEQATIGLLAEMRPDLFFVCDFGQILSKDILAVPPLGGINLHGSLLPAYRSAAPVNWAIYDGARQTGVSVIHMTPQLDAGPVLSSRSTPIGPAETAEELESRLAVLGVDAVRESIEQLASWDQVGPLGELQDTRFASRAPRLSKADGLVSWSRRATEIANQVRAFKPWPGTYTYFLREGQPTRLILNRVVATAESATDVDPGTIAENRELMVATGDYFVRLDSVQPAGRKSISGAEFLRGYRLQPGERFESVAEVS